MIRRSIGKVSYRIGTEYIARYHHSMNATKPYGLYIGCYENDALIGIIQLTIPMYATVSMVRSTTMCNCKMIMMVSRIAFIDHTMRKTHVSWYLKKVHKSYSYCLLSYQVRDIHDGNLYLYSGFKHTHTTSGRMRIIDGKLHGRHDRTVSGKESRTVLWLWEKHAIGCIEQ